MTTPLAFTAMDGIFPDCDDVESLWAHVLEARPAPATALCARWGTSPERMLAPLPARPGRAYTDLAFVLPERASGGGPPPASGDLSDRRWGRQWAFTRTVAARLLDGLPGPLDRSRLALVLGTSWSDESLYLADAALARTSGVAPGLDPGAQLATLRDALGCAGAALAVDTACSSFLYALDVARQLIESGQAEAALVAGVNAFLPLPMHLGFSQLRALSPDGDLAAFGAGASGLVPGEAVAAVLLEPCASALQAGRRPLGLLRSLGLSCDGREGAVFAPGREGQRRAYARAFEGGPLEVDYVEAHGTGTPVGDRTELETLTAFYAPRLARGSKLPLGSIKRLVGHSLAAAGASSLIKALLMLRERVIPPHRVGRPNEALAASCFTLPDRASAWTARDRPMRVAVSSFGFGGANAHLVVEAPPEGAWPAGATTRAVRPSLRGCVPLEVAIVAVDAALAGRVGLREVAAALAGEEPASAAFPEGRFAAGVPQPSHALHGGFFRGTVDVEAQGLGMGPRPLAVIDPYKLLVGTRVRRMVQELELIADDRTGVVAAMNLGGEGFFDLYRDADAYFLRGEGTAPALPAESVATMLPAMLSGYAALFCDVKGLHCTLSGGADLFLRTLLSAARWLGQRCDTLILASGRYIGSRTDLERLWRQTHGRNPVGEGLVVLALRRRGEGGGVEPPLATLRAFVEAEPGRDLDDAARLVGWNHRPATVEVCEWDPAAASAAGVHLRTGHLGEAAGSEALLALVLRANGPSAVEFREGGQVRGWLLLEAHRRPALQNEPAPQLPLTLRFSPTTSVAADVLPAPAAVTNSGAALVASSPSSEPPVSREAPLKALLEHFAEVTANVSLDLGLRRRAIELLGLTRGVPGADPLASLRRDRRHLVLDGLVRRGERHVSTLRVPEEHPFYFDHELDHVPGILLLEGMLQQCEAVFGSSATHPRDWFLSEIDIAFHRYTEKGIPAVITLQRGEGASGTAQVTVEQAGRLVCSARVEIRTGALRLLDVVERDSAAPTGAGVSGVPEARLIHKERVENVLVGALEASDTRVATRPVPAGHALADGDPRQLSMLYFLEVGRQAFMLNAHGRWGVPLGVPMNLLGLRFALEAPLPRQRTFTLRPTSAPRPWNGLIATSRFAIELQLGDRVLGHGELRAQAVAPALYEMQRRTGDSAA